MTARCGGVCVVLLLAVAVACREEAPPPAETAAGTARARLMNADGAVIGTATLSETDAGVQLELQASGLTPGVHGFHIHENGVCEPPEFQSAGGHFNPTGMEHGFDVPGGPHLGDLRNLEVPMDGAVKVSRTVAGATLGEGETSVLDKAIVIHEKADDYKSQPSGDAGARVACGVIQK